MNSVELAKLRADMWGKMRNFLDEHRDEKGLLNAADKETYAKMEKDLDAYAEEIERAKNLEDMEKSMSGLMRDPIKGGTGSKTPADARATDEYKREFVNYIRTRKASNALQEDTNSEGGYLVPQEFERILYEAREKVDPIFQLAGKITLGAKEKAVPYVASEGAATLIAEEGQYGETDDAFGQVLFRAYKFGRIEKASDELIADSAFDIFGHIARSLGRSIGKGEAAYFWKGTGSSQPQGVITAAGAGVTTASATQITADEIIDLYYSVPEEYRDGAVWGFNDATVKLIRKLKLGSGEYLWAPGLNGAPDTILGKRLHTSANIDTVAATKVVGVFGNIGECFKIADRQGFNLKVLTEKYADYGQVGFRGDGRTDSRGIYASTGIKKLTMHA